MPTPYNTSPGNRIIRGKLHGCLIVCPDSLVEQWQDELHQRLHLSLEIVINDRQKSMCTGNAFVEYVFTR